MKFLKRVLILLLILGVVWGIDKFKVQSEKLKVDQEKTETNPKPLKFAVMSDIHSDWENFKKALEKTKADMGVEDFGGVGGFVIITGDLTTIGKKSELIEAKKILDKSGLKYYVIPGNHDVWFGRKYKNNVWKEVFGESFTSFKLDGTKFILVNNGDGIGGINQFKVDEGENQMEWLKREVEECLKVYCLVFMHMPLNHPNSLHVMGEENPLVASEAGKIREVLRKFGVKEIFAGHLHFSSSYELDGLKTTIVGAITGEWNLQSPKFLEVWEENGYLKKEDVFLTD